jgi:nitrite reductase/ring-hydroxylating ferredoxin subunit
VTTIPEKQRLCALNEIPDPGTREFAAGGGEWPPRGILVRYQGRVYAFLNRCPHAGDLLNWGANSFLAPDRTLLLCTSHGALFMPDSGVCVEGPCLGRRLRPIEIEVIGGDIYLIGPMPSNLGPYAG